MKGLVKYVLVFYFSFLNKAWFHKRKEKKRKEKNNNDTFHNLFPCLPIFLYLKILLVILSCCEMVILPLFLTNLNFQFRNLFLILSMDVTSLLLLSGVCLYSNSGDFHIWALDSSRTFKSFSPTLLLNPHFDLERK